MLRSSVDSRLARVRQVGYTSDYPTAPMAVSVLTSQDLGTSPGQAPGSGGIPHGLDPNALNSIFGALGGGGGGQPSGSTGSPASGAPNQPLPPNHPLAGNNPLAILLGANGHLGAAGALRAQAQAAAAAPVDNRPPEERYAEQLRQLNDMGFYDFDRNVAALRRSGGSVQGAINELLGG